MSCNEFTWCGNSSGSEFSHSWLLVRATDSMTLNPTCQQPNLNKGTNGSLCFSSLLVSSFHGLFINPLQFISCISHSTQAPGSQSMALARTRARQAHRQAHPQAHRRACWRRLVHLGSEETVEGGSKGLKELF